MAEILPRGGKRRRGIIARCTKRGYLVLVCLVSLALASPSCKRISGGGCGGGGGIAVDSMQVYAPPRKSAWVSSGGMGSRFPGAAARLSLRGGSNHSPASPAGAGIGEGGGGFGGGRGVRGKIAVSGRGGINFKERGGKGVNPNKDCTDIFEAKDLPELISAVGSGWSAERTAQAYHRLKALIVSGAGQQHPHALPILLASLSDAALTHMGSFKPRHIGMALNAHAAMGRAPSPALLSSIQARSLVLAPLLDERGVSNTMWAFAKFGTAPNDELLAALEKRCMELITSYGPQSLANTIWGYAVLGVVPGGTLLQAWSDQARLRAAEMNPQNLANIMWAMGSLRLNPLAGDLVAEVERRSCDAMGDFTPQAISNVVWGFASCGVRPGDALIESLGGRAVQCVANFSAQAISNTLWGFATLGIHPDEQVMGALSSQAEVQVATFTPQNIANTMWAMACLRWTPSLRFQRCIEEQVEARIREFNAQDVANLAWGFATLGIAPSKGTLLRSLETQGCSRAREFTAQGISNMMWGCATLGVAPGADLVARVDQRAVEIMGQFNPQELSSFVWACGVLCIRPSSGLLQAVEARFGNILHCSPAQAVGNTMWGYAAMGLWPGEEVVVKSCNRMLHLLGDQGGVGVGSMTKRQAHQFCVAFALEGVGQRYSPEVSLLIEILKEASNQDGAIDSGEATVSRMQSDVAASIRGLGLEIREEIVDRDTGYSIDIVVQSGNARGGIALEVDGPSHFLRDTRDPTGATVMKRRHLALSGVYAAVISVPFWEWEEASKSPEARNIYLNNLLIGES